MLKKVDLKSGSIAQTTFGEAEYPAPQRGQVPIASRCGVNSFALSSEIAE